MKEVLQDSNRTKGVIGSMIVSGDGIVVRSSESRLRNSALS